MRGTKGNGICSNGKWMGLQQVDGFGYGGDSRQIVLFRVSGASIHDWRWTRQVEQVV